MLIRASFWHQRQPQAAGPLLLLKVLNNIAVSSVADHMEGYCLIAQLSYILMAWQTGLTPSHPSKPQRCSATGYSCTLQTYSCMSLCCAVVHMLSTFTVTVTMYMRVMQVELHMLEHVSQEQCVCALCAVEARYVPRQLNMPFTLVTLHFKALVHASHVHPIHTVHVSAAALPLQNNSSVANGEC